MTKTGIFTLRKEERICSRTHIRQLFTAGKNLSLAAFPLRMIAATTDRKPGQPAVQMMVSVPKRHLRHAVDRNRAKRQVREAYRRHKDTLTDAMADKDDRQLLVAFLWIDSRPHDSRNVEAKVENLIRRMAEKI